MRCSVCGSERLSPLGELRSKQTGNTTLRLLFDRPGTFQGRPTFDVEFARACLDCGALIPFLGRGARRRLAETTGLAGVDDWTDRLFDEEADAWVRHDETTTD